MSIISYGREDHDAWLAITPLSDVMRLLDVPLDTDAALSRLRREAATAVGAGALPAPAQPAPVPATIDAQVSLASSVEITASGDIVEPLSSLSTQEPQGEEAAGATDHDVATVSSQMPEPADDAKGYSALAEALAQAGRLDEAIAAFRICASLAEGADVEEGAWADVPRRGVLPRHRPAGGRGGGAGLGMAKHAGLGGCRGWRPTPMASKPPLPGRLLGGRAIALGHFPALRTRSRGPSRGIRRRCGEGPFDILRFALRRLGDDAGADEVESLFQAARNAREAAS